MSKQPPQEPQTNLTPQQKKISDLEQQILKIEKKILEIEKQIPPSTVEEPTAKKKKSQSEVIASETSEEVVMEIQYDYQLTNFLSGKTGKEDDEKVKRLKRSRDQLVQEQARELRDEAENNPANKANRGEDGKEGETNKGVITFGSYEEAEEFSNNMVKAYERLGIPCAWKYYPEKRMFVMKLPPQCRGKDVFSMSPEELAALREEIAKGSVTVGKELGVVPPLLTPTPTNESQPENGFEVTLGKLADKLSELAKRKRQNKKETMRGVAEDDVSGQYDNDSDADLTAQIAAIEALQEAVRSRMVEQLDREQVAKGREKSEDFVQIDMAQGEESAKQLAKDLESVGVKCSVVEKDGVFGVKIDLSNEVVKTESRSPSPSPRGAELDIKSPAIQLAASKGASLAV